MAITAKRSAHQRRTRQARRALNSTTEGPIQISGKRLVRVHWGTGISKRDLEGSGPSDYWDEIDEEIEQLGDPDDEDFWENRKEGPFHRAA